LTVSPLIDSRSLWVAETNCYVVAPASGGPAVVIDAPPDPEGVGAILAKHDLTPVALLVTHGHIDHAGGAGAVVRATGVQAYVHPDDDYLTLHPVDQLRMLFGVAIDENEAAPFAPPDRYEALAGGQQLELAGLTFEVLHTPGHTPGHCCFLLRDDGVLFSGDQLFAGSIGRTDLPGGDYDTLMQSMVSQVLPLPEDTEVLPGHGPATTLARERLINPFLQELLRP
jgi:glyoxylase-like metal-dependent hydrolase (beta-lactamase superfamily II)